MSEFDWAPFGRGGDFVKFDEVGDQVIGTIVAIRAHTFDEKKGPIPLIDLEPKDGGDLVTLDAGRVDLRRQLVEIKPQVGDLLAVKFVGSEKLPGKPQPMMKFAVKHKVGERPKEADPFAGTEDLSGYSEEPF